MHMCVSDIVKRKLNLTDKFIYGSILPDILKAVNKDRQSTHYLQQVIVDGERRNLPVIDKAVHELDIQDEEVRLGYIAHLVEDLIWFNEYIPKYTKIVGEDQIKYSLDNSIHTKEEFSSDMYSDYSNSSAYVIQKCNVDINKLKFNLKDIICNEQYIQIMDEWTQYLEDADISKNRFMTKESMDKYIEQTSKEVEKTILELMGE